MVLAGRYKIIPWLGLWSDFRTIDATLNTESLNRVSVLLAEKRIENNPEYRHKIEHVAYYGYVETR